MATETIDELKGTTILTQKEKEPAAKETQLFKSEQEKTNAVEEAKANALKELEAKTVAEKEASEKATADAAAKKAAEEKAKTDAEDKSKTDKSTTTPQSEYTLSLPENSPLTKEDLDGLLKVAKESGLTEEQAKKELLGKDQIARTAQSRLVTQQQEQMKTLVASWKETVNKDPEMGGEKLQETAIKASRAFKAVASPEMQKFCEQTGYADHPEMVRMMLKIYDLIGEDKFLPGSTGVRNTTPTTMEEKAKKLFGNPIKEA